MNELVLCTSDDGRTRLDLRIEGRTVWLSQLEIAELFQTTKQNVSLHASNIFEEGELSPAATVKESLTVQTEGTREVQCTLQLYNLDLILAIGYRVRSPRGVQFRQWATTHLREYLVKGFVMDDERLKNPGAWDYFDELLARIREIRASEKRFYQKVRDLFALSSDYQAREKETQLFFAVVQNKLLYAATRHTAAELIVARADPGRPNMALTTWSGSRVRKHDIIVAKNYLTGDEVDTLNRLTVIFLEQAELRAKQHKDLTLDFWRGSVDRMLASNDQPLLDGPGAVSHESIHPVRYTPYGLPLRICSQEPQRRKPLHRIYRRSAPPSRRTPSRAREINKKSASSRTCLLRGLPIIPGCHTAREIFKNGLGEALPEIPAQRLSHGVKSIAAERYESFDTKRRHQEAIAADAEDLKAIEDLEKDLKRKGGKA